MTPFVHAPLKIFIKLLRGLRIGGGSALPGLIALRLNPQIGNQLAKRLEGRVIVVTGTNGKTTTVKLIRNILTEAGYNVVSNIAGSNMERGFVSALIEQQPISGVVKKTVAVIEADEANVPIAVKMFRPSKLIVLNLFRDQLDRYGELDSIATIIGSSLSLLPDSAKVYLNADDPLVTHISRYADDKKVEYFGFNQSSTTKMLSDIAGDSLHCPICYHCLDYSKSYYSHIGIYACPEGHFARPRPAHEASFKDGQMTIDNQVVDIKLGGLYNAYNALAAYQITADFLPEPALRGAAIQKTKAAFGRIERFQLGGKQVTLLLIKNPTGFNQIIQTYLLGAQKTIYFLINDNFADGRDVSWLWDSALEEISSTKSTLYTGGIRGFDMQLRLKYADMPVADLGSVREVFEHIKAGREDALIVATYTAMREVRKLLVGATGDKAEWLD